MKTPHLFRQADNNRVKALIKDLPLHTDRVHVIVHSDVFQQPIINSKIKLN
jgi:hypothetical protein